MQEKVQTMVVLSVETVWVEPKALDWVGVLVVS